MRLAAACRVARPFLRQVKPIAHRQAGLAVGKRQRDRRLAVVLLAQLAAILPRHPDRVLALLRKAGVVDDPSLDRASPLDRRQHQLAHLGQHPLVRPGSLADKMQQRLMLRRRSGRCRHRRHRLDALALARHHQPAAVVAQRLDPVGMADHPGQALDIARKTLVASSPIFKTHPGSPAKMNPPMLPQPPPSRPATC